MKKRVDINFDLGTLIGTRRIAMDISQKELAARMELSSSYMCNIEAGCAVPKNPKLLAKFSKVLHIDLDVLCFAVGILPPDLPESASPECIKAGFDAMRKVLGS